MIKSPLRYPGGKSKAAKIILPKFPTDCSIYVEPFLGGGSMYFASRHMFDSHILSDSNQNLMDFWRAARGVTTNEELRKGLQFILDWTKGESKILKQLWDCYKEDPSFKLYAGLDAPNTLPITVASAIRFYFFNRCSFSGCTESGGFSPSASVNRFTQSSIDRLKEMPEALKGATLYCRDFDIAGYIDKDKKAFIFMDPPYYIPQGLYGKNGDLHKDFDHERLAGKVKTLESKFLITYNDCEYIRELYKDFKIKEWELGYSMSEGKNKKGKELFISNY